MPYKKVLTASDFSPFGDQAVERAKALAKGADKLTILHVMDPPALQDPLYAHYGLSVSKEQLDAAKQKAMGMLKQHYGDDSDLQVRIGDATTEIISAAQEVGAEVIVLSTHGRRGYSRFVFGSVCERVVRMAQCDVLVVRAKSE